MSSSSNPSDAPASTPDTPEHTAQDATAKPAEGFKPTREHVKGRNPLWQLLGVFSSLKMAASLIALLSVVIGVATYYERDYGREMAALNIYSAWWFNLIFLLLAVNIFGAAAVRFPWKKRQIGFVVTHAGLLILMAGFAIAGHDGVERLDGMLGIPEGETGSEMELIRDVVTARIEGPQGAQRHIAIQSNLHAGYPTFLRYCFSKIWPLPQEIAAPADQRIPLGKLGEWDLSLGRVVDTGESELGWEADPNKTGPLAIKFGISATLPASMVNEEVWLHTSGNGKHTYELGPFALNMLKLPAGVNLDLLLNPPYLDASQKWSSQHSA